MNESLKQRMEALIEKARPGIERRARAREEAFALAHRFAEALAPLNGIPVKAEMPHNDGMCEVRGFLQVALETFDEADEPAYFLDVGVRLGGKRSCWLESVCFYFYAEQECAVEMGFPEDASAARTWDECIDHILTAVEKAYDPDPA